MGRVSSHIIPCMASFLGWGDIDWNLCLSMYIKDMDCSYVHFFLQSLGRLPYLYMLKN